MVQSVTNENIQELLDAGKPLVIDFWAGWCGPCKTIAPFIDELADEYGDRVTVAKCDIESNDSLAVRYGVRSIPTVLFIKGGEVVDKHVGATSKAVLDQKLVGLL